MVFLLKTLFAHFLRVSHNLCSYAKTTVINSHIPEKTFLETNYSNYSCGLHHIAQMTSGH